MISFNTNVLGVDISTSYVKISQITKKRKSLSIKLYEEERIPVSALVAGVIRQPANVQRALLNCLIRAKFKTVEKLYAVCTIPDDKVYTQEATFPDLSEDKLHEAIAFKIQSFIPLPIKDVYWDFQVITKNADQTLKVIIAAASKETVDSYYDVIRSAGLTPLAFESSSTSAVRVINSDAIGDAVLLDIGTTQTTISVAERNTIKLSSTVHIGLNQLIKVYDEYFKTDDDKSLQLLKESGIAMSNQGLKDKLDTVFEPLLQEVRRAIAFENEKDDVKIVLYGEGAVIKGFPDLIMHKEHTKVVYPQLPVKKLENISEEKVIPALGAAMRSFIPVAQKTINFLPPHASKLLLIKETKQYIFSALKIISYNMLAYIAVFIILIGFFSINLQYLKQKLDSLSNASSQSAYASTGTIINAYNKDLTKIGNAQGAVVDWSGILTELPQLVPSGIQLTSYQMSPQSNLGWAVSLSGVASTRAALLLYLNNLEYHSRYLTNVVLPAQSLQDNTNIHFTITAQLLKI